MTRRSSSARSPRWRALLVFVVVSLMAGPALLVSEPIAGAAAGGSAAVPAGQAELSSVLDAGIAFVERVRGLRFKHRPQVLALDNDSFLRRVRADIAKNRDRAGDRKADAFLKALGLLAPDADLGKLSDAFLEGALGGFYDAKTKALVVRADDLGPTARAAIVHELTHALEDQWFDLDRPELDKRADDSASAFQVLAEGSASYVERRYRQSFSARDRRTAAIEERRIGRNSPLPALARDPRYRDAIPFIGTDLAAPYVFGERFVAALRGSRGAAGWSAAFRSPPVTTEQATSLRKYVEREAARVVPVPAVPAKAEVIDRGVAGLLGLNSLLASPTVFGFSVRISTAVQGWAGDRYVIWQTRDQRCFRLDVAMDTPAESERLASALRSPRRWRRSWRVSSRPDGVVRLDSCNRRT